jgi:hypothetical protein
LARRCLGAVNLFHLEAKQREWLQNTTKNKLTRLDLTFQLIPMLDGISAHKAEIQLHLCRMPQLAIADSAKIESGLIHSMTSDLELMLLEIECFAELVM